MIDDDESVRELCCVAFRLEGFEVEAADSGEKGVARLEGPPFDVVLTDLFMPGKLDGQGVVRAVKARYPSTEVVVMTAVPTLRSAIATLKDGASDYVVKPFETDHLKVVVRRALEYRRMRRELDTERSMRQELASAYAELQKVEELKESFLSRISHELRTPLSELLTAVDLMEQIAGTTSDPRKLEKYLTLSKAGAKRLETTLSDLLAFVELQRQQTLQQVRPVDLEVLCRESVAKLRPLWEPRRLQVKIRFDAGSTHVAGDAALLARALEHLLHNAIVFNREGGRVSAEGKVEGPSVLLSIADTGEGIPEGEFDKIFDSFYQVANYLTRKVGGLGLGLAITRRIVEAHGGEIAVTSRVGEGTAFRVRFPLPAPEPFPAEQSG